MSPEERDRTELPETEPGAPGIPIGELIFKETKARSLWGDAFRRMIANKLTLAGLIGTTLFLLIAIIGPVLAPYSYTAQDYGHARATPSREHLLGTDELGRDFLSRLLFGARTAAFVSVFVTLFSTVVGVLLGAAGAYLGGLMDQVVVRLVDVTMTIPGVLLASLANVIFKPVLRPSWEAMSASLGLGRDSIVYLDLIIVIFAIGLTYWPSKARLIRGQILSLREELYVDAARSIGATNRQVLMRHIIPNALGPVIVAVTFTMAGAIGLESGLSFLGIGVQPPAASWGAMIGNALGYWRFYPWLLAAPAIVLAIVSLSIQFLGDGLNDALDPRRLT